MLITTNGECYHTFYKNLVLNVCSRKHISDCLNMRYQALFYKCKTVFNVLSQTYASNCNKDK